MVHIGREFWKLVHAMDHSSTVTEDALHHLVALRDPATIKHIEDLEDKNPQELVDNEWEELERWHMWVDFSAIIFSLTHSDHGPDQSQDRNLDAYWAFKHLVPNLTTTLKGSTPSYLKKFHQEVYVAHLGNEMGHFSSTGRSTEAVVKHTVQTSHISANN